MVSQIKHIIITVLCIHSLKLNIAGSLSFLNAEKLETNKDKSCALPVESDGKIFKIINILQTQGHVPERSMLYVTCAPGYLRDDSAQDNPHTTQICLNQTWSPKFECAKKCDKLNFKDVTLQCFRNGKSLGNCDENSVLLAGTIVRRTCKIRYKYSISANYSEITCGEDGKWEGDLSCTPECGKSGTGSEPMTADGNPEVIGGSPWHVAIFNTDKVLICGGTIISKKLVVTAAHCFHWGNHCGDSECTPNYCNGTKCAGSFEVVVGKYHRNYMTQDSFQKTMKIKEIRFSEKGFYPSTNQYPADIALIILQDPISPSPKIMPACLNWEDLKNRKYPLEDTLGKFVGWPKTENDTHNPILRSFTSSYVGYGRCKGMLPKNTCNTDFATAEVDQFCIQTKNFSGNFLKQGNSGGGILFKEEGLFYLRGVASLSLPSSSTFPSITAFTDLSDYVHWILSVCNSIEKTI